MSDIATDIARLLRQNDLLNTPAIEEAEEIVAHLIRYHIRRYTAARGAVDMSGYAVHHLDGNPHNHELSNLRLVNDERLPRCADGHYARPLRSGL